MAIKEAFNQINHYQRDSFWAGCGLYECVQIFVISNGTFTKYYSNTTRASHIKESENSSKKHSKKTSNSFEFTSYWADGNNKVIPDLVDFAKTFFAKHIILNILTKYCVFTSEESLLVMRPYQIVATERILNRIEVSTNYKKKGTIEAGGYIWHTTGSGKTLTSFKTAQLATNLPYIEKFMFVFDECHRSQFGDMRARIVGGQIKEGEKTIKVEKYFKNYHNLWIYWHTNFRSQCRNRLKSESSNHRAGFWCEAPYLHYCGCN